AGVEVGFHTVPGGNHGSVHQQDKIVLKEFFDKRFKGKPAAGNAQKNAKSVVNSVDMKLMLIPSGEFMMGSRELPSELPIHNVRITKDFYLAGHHVTVGQFRAFVTDSGYKTDAETKGKGATGFDAEARWVATNTKYNWKNPGFEQGNDHPVVCVSWNDAR